MSVKTALEPFPDVLALRQDDVRLKLIEALLGYLPAHATSWSWTADVRTLAFQLAYGADEDRLRQQWDLVAETAPTSWLTSLVGFIEDAVQEEQ